MPLLPKGRYKAIVKSAIVDRLGQNDLSAISLYLEGYEFKNDNGDYETMDQTGWGITADQYLEQKDGGVNEGKIRLLAKVFDWNGDLMTVDGFVGKHVKITVEEREYKGKVRTEVSWLNHIDDGDGPARKEFDSSKAASVQKAIGSKIRALLGSAGPALPRSVGSSAPRPVPASTPVATATPSVPPVPTSAPQHTIESVWGIVEQQLVKQNVPKDMHGSAWDTFLREQGHPDASKVTDWAPLAEAAATWDYIPFG
jgi:hypothetical protein